MLKILNLLKKYKLKKIRTDELLCITDGTPNPPILSNAIKNNNASFVYPNVYPKKKL